MGYSLRDITGGVLTMLRWTGNQKILRVKNPGYLTKFEHHELPS